jgi:hypothetical protein
VIHENISEANMLNSFDEQLNLSIQKGQNFMAMKQRASKIPNTGSDKLSQSEEDQ